MKIYTNTEVASLALGFIGSSVRIANLDTDKSNSAEIIKRHFEAAIDTTISKHDWKAYSRIAPLVLVQDYFDENYRYAYAMPADGAIIRRISERGLFLPYQENLAGLESFQSYFDPSRGGFIILTNVPYAYAKYSLQVPVVGPFVGSFAKALAAQLALDIAPSLITNNYFKVKEALRKELRNEISEGIAQDIGLSPDQNYFESPFISVR